MKRFLLGFALALFVACGDDESSFAPRDEDSSSSVCEDCDETTSSSWSEAIGSSSSSMDSILSSSDSRTSSSLQNDKKSSSSSRDDRSNSSVASSSSVTPKSSSSETSESSSSEKGNPWGSDVEWSPFNCKAFGGCLEFTDTRDNRTYKYLKFESNYSSKSIYAMVENLNVGDMVKGYKNQQDDSKIEKYCYDNDTLICHYYGGLYQWAEMMQLPSECNTKSCADLIQENHQGICPDGWRLMTAADFDFIVKSNGNKDGVEGTRSTFGFGGYNTTGFSLVGAGSNWDHSFGYLNHSTYWFYPEESSDDSNLYAFSSSQGINEKYNPMDQVDKTHGFSVRCVMVE